MPKTRKAMIDTMNSLVGLNEKDGSFKIIIDTYNKLRLAGSYKMKYTDAWCACTVSTCALVNNMADIIPIDVSCGKMLEKAKKMGIWVEDDAFIAQPGDIILYDWGDSGKGDCTGWPDHVGLVVDTDGTTMTIVEGNKAERVGIRKLKYNSKNIRGFITPKYVDGVTQTPKAVKPIETAAYKARVTASALWVRAGASTKYGKVGCLRQNTIVNVFEVKNGWGRINKSANMWISLKYTAKL